MGDMADDTHDVLEIQLVFHFIGRLGSVDNDARAGQVVPAFGDVDDAGAVGGGNDEIVGNGHLGNSFIEAVQLLQGSGFIFAAIWVHVPWR